MAGAPQVRFMTLGLAFNPASCSNLPAVSRPPLARVPRTAYFRVGVLVMNEQE
jgi:hypothetical protein